MTRRRNASDLNAAILGSSVPSVRHRVMLATFDAQIAMVDHLLAGLSTTREGDEPDISNAAASSVPCAVAS